MSRWLITGAGGMLGRDLVTVLDRCGAPVTGLSRADLDITKITDELGYQPSVTLDVGLAATIDWYSAHRAWWEPLRQGAT